MSYDSLKSDALAAIAKAFDSAGKSSVSAQMSEAAAAQALTDLTAARSAVMAIQPDPVVPPVVVPPVITPDGYANTVVDKAGITWTIVNGQLALNSKVNPVTNRVSRLYAKAGVCDFVNLDGIWYQPNPDGVSNSKVISDPTGTPTPPPVPGDNGYAAAQAGPAWYKGKLGAPLLKDDFTGTTLDTSTWWPARNPGEAWSGPFNSGEQEIFTGSQVALDGQSYVWLSTAANDTNNLVNGVKLPYKSGCIIAQKPYWLWGENTFMQARVIFMPGSLNWQSIGGYGALNGYPYELDWFELVGGMLLVNKHTADANGKNTEIGQSGWGPANPADGLPHDIALEWVPGKLSLYFDHVLVASRNVPRDRAIQPYSVTMNNAIRGGGTPTLGRSMGIDYMVLSPVTTPAS